MDLDLDLDEPLTVEMDSDRSRRLFPRSFPDRSRSRSESPVDMESLSNGSATSATTTTNTTNPPSATAPVPQPSKLAHLTESLKLEHQLLRVPFEHYKKTIRANHRAVEKEVSAVISGVSDAVDSDVSKDDAVHRLTSLVSRLQGLKRKVRDS